MSKKYRHKSAYPIIEKAAILLLKCAGFMDDQNSAVRTDDQHSETYYAIDNDVIHLYIEPASNVDYLDVFGEGSNSSTAKSLAFLVADFLVKSSEPLVPGHEKQKCRFLIIPPHDEELLRTLTTVHDRLSRYTDVIDDSTFAELSKAFMVYEQDSNEQALLDALGRHVPDLVQLFNPYRGPRAALARYAQLGERTFQRIETYLDNSFTFPVLDPLNKREDREIANKLIKEWKARLKKQKVLRKPARALNNDAEVLAAIEHINLDLCEKSIRKQIVLVTGSNYLFVAASEYKPYANDERSFADIYLRHPQAFLAHPKFFSLSVSENATFKLMDWLNLFFPSELQPAIEPQGIVRREFLRNFIDGKDDSLNIVTEVLARSDKNAYHLLKEWRTQVASVAQARYADGLDWAKEKGAKELAKKLGELRQKTGWSIEKLRDMIFMESLLSVSSLYWMTVWVGLWSSAVRVESKGVPALRFDGEFKELEQYRDAVIQLQLKSVEKGVSKEELDTLRKLSKKVEETDDSLYHAHVIHALAFATKGHWHATLTLARIAMAICDYHIDPTERRFRWGREAAYLACIAVRRSIKNRSGLSDAEKYLDEAIKRENEGWPEDIRFSSERLTIQTRYHFFDLFFEPKRLASEAVFVTMEALCRLIQRAENEEDKRVKLWVERQVLTNFFTLLLIARELKPLDNLLSRFNIVQFLLVFQRVLKEICEEYQEANDDPYSRLICKVSTAIWDPNQQVRESARDAASQTLSQEPKFFMPYDEERYALLKRSIQGGCV